MQTLYKMFKNSEYENITICRSFSRKKYSVKEKKKPFSKLTTMNDLKKTYNFLSVS